jgi:CBS domain containing-hemolysin-like protein
MDVVVYLLVILACTVFSAFFSAGETALLRLSPTDAERDAETARTPAVLAVRNLVRSTSRILVTILLGNSVATIVGASVAAALAIRYLGDRAGIAVAATAMTLVILIFGEVLPKAIAARHPRRVARAAALPLYVLHKLLHPVHRLFDWAIEPLVRLATGERPGDRTSTSEDIMRLARSIPDRHPRGSPLAIIAAAAGAAQRTVAEIMVPRTEIVGFPIGTSPGTLLEDLLRERYTRVPIYEGSIDRILGTAHLKDLVKLVRDGGSDLGDVLKPVLRVPERKPVLRLLAEMQHSFVHVAIVKDEFGVTQGMVTQEDILEELVGEIRDEFDREELNTISRLPDGSYRVVGRVLVLDFNRETGCRVEAEPGDTLGGLIFNTLGHPPATGDTVRIGKYALSVEDVSGNRVTQLRVAAAEADVGATPP